MTLTWMNLFIVAAVASLALILLGRFWNLIKTFIKLWLVIVLILVVIKWAGFL